MQALGAVHANPMSISALSGERSMTARRSELPVAPYGEICSHLACVGTGRARHAERTGIAHRCAARAAAQVAALLKWQASALLEKKPRGGCDDHCRAMTLYLQPTVTHDCVLAFDGLPTQTGARAIEGGVMRL